MQYLGLRDKLCLSLENFLDVVVETLEDAGHSSILGEERDGHHEPHEERALESPQRPLPGHFAVAQHYHAVAHGIAFCDPNKAPEKWESLAALF